MFNERFPRRSKRSPYSAGKSAPIVDLSTDDRTKQNLNERLSLKSMDRTLVLYVGIFEPFAAIRIKFVFGL